MKYTIITIAALAANTLSLVAVTATESELTQLQAQHAKALAAAAEPINRRQITALEMLQRKATQAGDLEAAIKIKAELAKLTAANATLAQGADTLAKRLVGTKWAWFQKETITFRTNGKVEWSRGREPWPWKVENADQRVISCDAVGIRKKITITFDADFQTGSIAGEDGERKTRNVTKEP